MFVCITIFVHAPNSQSLQCNSIYWKKFCVSGSIARYLVMRKWTAMLCKTVLSTPDAPLETDQAIISITVAGLLLNDL